MIYTALGLCLLWTVLFLVVGGMWVQDITDKGHMSKALLCFALALSNAFSAHVFWSLIP